MLLSSSENEDNNELEIQSAIESNLLEKSER